ncbi:CDP-glycerol glycerophosphotransferase [Eggerthellaceae bacterium zg-886]|uniref:CDP-glycerol glycerophosphotransferase n=1 Tax=Xiamenia xianingshaonis TaxID=2682776 RepID=A0ABX0ILD0_9ACTN|nr:CDP-glycerol glycerophosphotransferase [Xiamenia xianingshaonis]
MDSGEAKAAREAREARGANREEAPRSAAGPGSGGARGTGVSRPKAAAVACLRGLLNAWYRLCRAVLPRRNQVLLLSRQSDEPSYDFQVLAGQFRARGFSAVVMAKRLSRKNAPAYGLFALRQTARLAQSRLCVIDGYNPVVSLLSLDVAPDAGQIDARRADPVVIQIWHAFGAFKAFGRQSTDTAENCSGQTADLLRMHKNYSWAVCSGERCREAYAQAFGMPVERVVAKERPWCFKLKRLGKARRAKPSRAGGPRGILFAPTLRKNPDSPRPLSELYEAGAWKRLEDGGAATVVWSFHPLERKGRAGVSTLDALMTSDLLVTDYSSVVFEACLLGVPTLFYVPDIDWYRRSPGLNADPAMLCPNLCFTDEAALLEALEGFASGTWDYPWDEYRRFGASAFDEGDAPDDALADFAASRLGSGRTIDDGPCKA